jgi:hypothetical protein
MWYIYKFRKAERYSYIYDLLQEAGGFYSQSDANKYLFRKFESVSVISQNYTIRYIEVDDQPWPTIMTPHMSDAAKREYKAKAYGDH